MTFPETDLDFISNHHLLRPPSSSVDFKMCLETNLKNKTSTNLYHDDIFDAVYLVLFNVESLFIILGNLLVITVIIRYVMQL